MRLTYLNKYILVTISICWLSTICYSQDINDSDELEFTRIDSLINTDAEKAYKAADNLGNKSELSNDYHLQAKAYRLKGKSLYRLDRHEESAFANMECSQLLIRNGIKDSLLIGQGFYAAAENYFALGLFELTKELSHRALKFFDPATYYNQRSYAFNLLSDVYRSQGNYEQALIYYDSTYQLDLLLNDTFYIAADLSMLGRINAKLGRNEESLSFLNDAFDLLDKDKHLSELSITYNAQGLAYADMNDFDNASKNIHKALEIAEKINDTHLITNRMINLCDLYSRFEKYDEGKMYCDRSLELMDDSFEPTGHTMVYQNLGKIYHAKKRYKEAEENLNKALNIAKKGNMLPLMRDIYKSLATQNIEKGNPETAFNFMEMHQEIADSIFSLNAHVEANALKFKYESVKKEAEIKALKLNNELKEKDLVALKTRQRGTLFSTILLSILGLFGFFLYRQKQINVLALKEKEMEKQLSKISSLQQDIARALDQKPTKDNTLSFEVINQLINEDLTDREYEILELVLDGHTNQQIADKVFLSVNTIKFHLKKIYTKLDVANRVEVMQLLLKK